MTRHSLTALALGAAALGCVGLAGGAAPPAGAAWREAQLVSVDNGRLEQADGATTAVDISGDGRWVVFQTRASNFFADDDPDAPGTTRQGGVFRFDRRSGAIALVADGDVLDEATGELLRRGAAAPSISDDGRWISFSTAQALVPRDANDNIDVYVRDMTRPLAVDRAASGAYALVSARDGGDEPASYEPRDPPLPGRTPGAAVFTGQSISGDGRFVAFRTTEQKSDLPARDAIDTPPGNVFVRDLAAKRTVLVSRALDGATAAGGALAPVTLSRDGSTVAWVGQNTPAQTRMLDGEGGDPAQRYYLWRRWDEAGATTRRVTGMADPDDPACPPNGRVTVDPVAVAPCYGPLTDSDAGGADIGGRAPALSADGWTVAFLSGAGSRPSVADDLYLDAYVTSMRPGVTRKQGTRAITKGTTAANVRANGDIESIAISGDGNRVVVVTTRRDFLPPAPPFLGEARTSAPELGSELYSVDLGAGGGLRRVLAPGGREIDGGLDQNPAISADGLAVAFTARASNLVVGDGNDHADAFATDDVPDVRAGRPPAGLGSDPVQLDVGSDSDDFDVRATARRDGSLRLRVLVPEAGTLRAVASTRPRTAGRGGAGGRDRARSRSRARSRADSRARASARAKRPRPRQVSSARARARRRGTVSMTLRLAPRDLRAVRRGTPLPVSVVVTLNPSRGGARARRATTTATFKVPAKKRSSRAVNGA